MARAEDLPLGPWSSQAQDARIEGGILHARLPRRDGTLVDASVQLDRPSLANFDGSFVPMESYPHLRDLANAASSSSGGGLSPSTVTALETAGTAAVAIAGALLL